jgi:hypothetical protein
VRTYVQEVELGRPRPDRRDDGDTVLLGEENAAVGERLLDAFQVVVVVGIAPGSVGDLGSELVPELADERQVVGCGETDHGVRNCARR